MKIVDALEPVSFEKGEAIISEGELGDTFYIIEQGSVNVIVQHEQMAKKKRGDYFGGNPSSFPQEEYTKDKTYKKKKERKKRNSSHSLFFLFLFFC